MAHVYIHQQTTSVPTRDNVHMQIPRFSAKFSPNLDMATLLSAIYI